MCNGLGMDMRRLRSRAWDDKGPQLFYTESDWPTSRNAAARCTDWDDFTDRLDWVLHTMPQSAITLTAPDQQTIQFTHQYNGTFSCEASHDPGNAESARRMAELGWTYETTSYPRFELWSPPTGRAGRKPVLNNAAYRAVTTFREVYGIDSLRRLQVEVTSLRSRLDEMSYVAIELGLKD
ncbi:hypothetical protein DFR76_10546 [Nocardia pseudobrasiliensis]|uniref:TY-Chap N-terminal domain-containing protein n=2 Tax=Nocardia pseudobrasiliensis TaxID=45979 RepID=A0A370I6K1_9NOCA|nr:hypothetical protein DFR76_10546 [Nocardia pseudobrasiliensis]